MAETNQNYETIDRPYDSFLEREETLRVGQSNSSSAQKVVEKPPVNAVSTASSPSSGSNGNVETQPVKSDGSFGDVWIKNFIRSENWKPKKVGFYIDGLTGYAEFCNVYVSGNIQALTGLIGGWTIGASTITATGVTLSSAGDAYISVGTAAPVSPTIGTGIFINKTGLYGLNANTQNFILDASNGFITAKAGTIGNFTMTSSLLHSGTIATGANVGIGTSGVIMDSNGLRGYDSILGKVFDIHTDGTAPEFLSGKITDSIFEISTNAVLRTSETVGDGSGASSGVLINSTGIYGCGENQTPSTANFRILNTGGGSITLGTTGFIKGGQTDYETGNGFFLGYSTDDYKFSIGDADNFLKWDGVSIVMKGSFEVSGTGGVINNAVYTVANLPASPTAVGFNNPSAYE